MRLLHIGLCATGRPYNGLQSAMIRKFEGYREINSGVPNLNEEIKRAVTEFNPDICFLQIQKGGVITEDTATFLKDRCFTVNWTGDIRQPTPDWYYQIGKCIDLTLFTNMNDVDNLNTITGCVADYLDIGINPSIYTPVGETLTVPPIVFLANNYNEKFQLGKFRIDLVEFMRREFGSRFGVYGNGWRRANGTFTGSQEKEAAAYRGAKIGINCSNIEGRRYSSDRILRIMGSGAMCLCKWYPEIEKDYIDGEHLKIWNTFDELRSLCNKYLGTHDIGKEEERKRIAANGTELIHRTKTFDCMITGLIELYHKYK